MNQEAVASATSRVPPADYPSDLAWPTTWQTTFYRGKISANRFIQRTTPCITEGDAIEAGKDALFRIQGVYGRDVVVHTARTTIAVREEEARYRDTVVENTFLGYPWWNANPAGAQAFPRFPANERSMVSFYQSVRDAQLGKRTTAKIGRFLSLFFPEVPEDLRLKAARIQTTGFDADSDYMNEEQYPIFFDGSREKMRWVFVNGPLSCMATDAIKAMVPHPAEVYAAGDLEIAYMVAPQGEKHAGLPICRALVWREKKTFGFMYPKEYSSWALVGFHTRPDEAKCIKAFTARLAKMGFSQPAYPFTGARLKAIYARPGRFLLPYLDHHGYGYQTEDGWTLAGPERNAIPPGKVALSRDDGTFADKRATQEFLKKQEEQDRHDAAVRAAAEAEAARAAAEPTLPIVPPAQEETLEEDTLPVAVDLPVRRTVRRKQAAQPSA